MNENQILEAIREAMGGRKPETGITVLELAAYLGVGEFVARKQIKALLQSGRMETCRVMRTRMDGVEQPTSGYKLKT